MSERKRVLQFWIVAFVAVVLFTATLSFMGNPISGDTWSHQFPNHASLYVNSYQQPPSLGVRRSKTAGMISFGHVDYLWPRN